VALSLAKNLRHLAERKTDVLHQARAAFLLADAWYLVGALPFSIDWSKRGFGEAKPLEMRGQGGRPYRVLYAEQEANLALRLALQGGMYAQAVRLIDDALNRYQALNDTAGQSSMLGVLAEIHMLQGRWAESVDAARRSLQVADPLPDKARTAHALWAGARSAARLGNLETARAWAMQARTISRQDDLPALTGAYLAEATMAVLTGDPSGAIPAADRAVALANAWNADILRHWAMLERSWIRMAAGQIDLDEMRTTVAAFAKSGAGTLEAEAWYALHHALESTGQPSQAEYNKAQEQFERLKMDWHAAKASSNETLLIRVG